MHFPPPDPQIHSLLVGGCVNSMKKKDLASRDRRNKKKRKDKARGTKDAEKREKERIQ